MKKICFISSSGGHLEQLQMLMPSMQENSFIVTEKVDGIENENYYELQQINRREVLFIIKILFNTFKSLMIFVKEKPDIVICTVCMATSSLFSNGLPINQTVTEIIIDDQISCAYAHNY